MKFYYPLKPTRITIDSNLFKKCESDLNYILQVKKNGWRTQIHKDKDRVEFFSRHNNKLESIAQDADWKMLTNLILNNVKAESCILDGEFLHRRGSLKNTIFVWDIFEHNQELVRKPYSERKQLLESIVTPSSNLFISKDHNNNFIEVWNNLVEEEDEGVVIKDLRELLYVSFNKTIESPRQFKILLEDKRNTVSNL
jgi:ATP-dependent DNA ligase